MITKKVLLKFVEKTGNYENVDEYLIDEVIFNLRTIKQAKAEIKSKGLIVNISKKPDEPFYQKNPAMAIYDSSIKNVLNISRKLGLSAFDRRNLGIKVDNYEDGF